MTQMVWLGWRLPEHKPSNSGHFSRLILYLGENNVEVIWSPLDQIYFNCFLWEEMAKSWHLVSWIWGTNWSFFGNYSRPLRSIFGVIWSPLDLIIQMFIGRRNGFFLILVFVIGHTIFSFLTIYSRPLRSIVGVISSPLDRI